VSLLDNLKLSELLKDGEIKSYLAAEPQFGRNVLLHWLPAGSDSQTQTMTRMLLQVLDEISPEGRALILEAGIREGRMYLITEKPAEFHGLKEWLHEITVQKVVETSDDPLSKRGKWQSQPALPGEPQPPATAARENPAEVIPVLEVTQEFNFGSPQAPPIPLQAPVPQAARPQSGPGEFTRMFAPQQMSSQPPQAPAKDKEAGSAAPPAPGEFTRMFAASNKPSDTPSSQSSQQPPAAPSREPGEFTRIFLATPGGSPPSGSPASPGPKPPTSPKPMPAARPAAPNQPGEFTRMFQSPAANLEPAAPLQPRDAAPGEFTKFFQSPLASPTPHTPSDDYFSNPAGGRGMTEANNAGEFTRMFGTAGSVPTPTPEPTIAPAKPQELPGLAISPQSPGEYTRMFATPAEPAEQQHESPVGQAKPAVVKKQRSPLLPILLFAILAVLALILVFVFARR